MEANKHQPLPSNLALKTGISAQLLVPLRSPPGVAEGRPQPCKREGFRISSAVPTLATMKSRSGIRSVLAGLLVTLAQIFVAVVIIAPEGPLSIRYDTLVQHDSYWFANILERGYGTTVPPIDRKIMEVSNVAFFPAYPVVAALLRYCLHLSTHVALLLAAQIAAWGFWTYFFLFCDRWKVSRPCQWLAALAIAAHPAAFFLIAGYSESLFLMALFGFMYWSSTEGGRAKVLAVIHGYVISATRIVGLPCALFPVLNATFQKGSPEEANGRSLIRRIVSPIAIMLGASLGAISFFLYCFVRWGRWDLYMLTQNAGWAIVPDYLAVFKPENYHWLVPALRDPTQASQMVMTLGALLLVAIVLCELLPVIRRSSTWTTRLGFYFCGAIIYYLSVSGVACVQMESMLRYEFCLHALMVLAIVHLLQQVRLSFAARVSAVAVLGVLSASGLALQFWYVWNFTRGGWVA